MNCTWHLDTRSSLDPCSQYLRSGFVSKDWIGSWWDICIQCDLREIPFDDIYNRGSSSSNSRRWVKFLDDLRNIIHKLYIFRYILSSPNSCYFAIQNRLGIQIMTNGKLCHSCNKRYILIAFPKFPKIQTILLYQAHR